MIIQDLISLFHMDMLAIIMLLLVAFIGTCVGSFAFSYMKGDKKQGSFFMQFIALLVSVAVMATADHLALLFASWCVGNFLLVRLMIHKSGWNAAKAAGRLAEKNYVIGALSIAGAFSLIYQITGETSIQVITHQSIASPVILPILILLTIGALTQSALWPFHRWLTSSLNSPTPVSAMMHAGLVNGGGFLLARFAPIYSQYPGFYEVIFFVGFVTAFTGTLWKLIQSDVKRMLACSTMGQMGFMIMQCGLGLFPAAVAHLVWHGLFKAYLFLSSGAAAQEKRHDLDYRLSLQTFSVSIISGIFGASIFTITSNIHLEKMDTTLFLVGMSFIAATQFALSILDGHALKKLPLALMGVITAGAIYGWSVRFFETLMPEIMVPQPLGILHIVGFCSLAFSWLAILFMRVQMNGQEPAKWMQGLYVSILNASQPHPLTVTAHRNDYQYK